MEIPFFGIANFKQLPSCSPKKVLDKIAAYTGLVPPNFTKNPITWNHEIWKYDFHVKFTWFHMNSSRDHVKFTKISHFTWNFVIVISREEALHRILLSLKESLLSKPHFMLLGFFRMSSTFDFFGLSIAHCRHFNFLEVARHHFLLLSFESLVIS